MGEWDKQVDAFERARDHATTAGDDRRMVDIWNEFGGAMLFGPTPFPEVITFVEEEMAWARDKGYPGVEADAALDRAVLLSPFRPVGRGACMA